MFALLLGAGVIYLVLGDLTEALMLLVFATISVSITVVQELRSERVLEALRDMTSPRALVIRDGVRRRIPGREVVRGDAVVVLEGDRVPADAVLAAASNLLVDESLLTGEAIPVRKSAGTAGAAMARPGGEDLPFVFSGTLVVGGEGVAIVRSTGAAQRDRQDRPGAGQDRARAAAPAAADAPAGPQFRGGRHGHQPARRPALRLPARRLAARRSWAGSRSACRCCRRSSPWC